MSAFCEVTPRSLFLVALLGGLAAFLQGCGYYSKRVECHDGCSLDISCDGKELVRKPNSGCKDHKEFKSEPTEYSCSDVLERSHEDLTKLCWPLFSDSHPPPYRQGNTTKPAGNSKVTTTGRASKTLTEVERDQEDGDEVSVSTTAEPGLESKTDGNEGSDSRIAELDSETKAETETEGEETEAETKADIEEAREGDETELKTKAETITETKPEQETAELGPATSMETEGDLKADAGLLQMSESASAKESLGTGSMNSHQPPQIDDHRSELVELVTHHHKSPDTWDGPKRDAHGSRFLGYTLSAA